MITSRSAAVAHWATVWHDRDPDTVTWFQPDLSVSRRLIARAGGATSSIIDVGGGASRLVDHLVDAGYRDVTVLDIAASALDAARERLGHRADPVCWIDADVTEVEFERTFDIWHDRAVFHFLIDPDDRGRYLANLRHALPVGGHLVLSTFGPDGPEQCSGLPVRRYDLESMGATLGDCYELVTHEFELHVAPSGATQQFLSALFRRTG